MGRRPSSGAGRVCCLRRGCALCCVGGDGRCWEPGSGESRSGGNAYHMLGYSGRLSPAVLVCVCVLCVTTTTATWSQTALPAVGWDFVDSSGINAVLAAQPAGLEVVAVSIMHDNSFMAPARLVRAAPVCAEPAEIFIFQFSAQHLTVRKSGDGER